MSLSKKTLFILLASGLVILGGLLGYWGVKSPSEDLGEYDVETTVVGDRKLPTANVQENQYDDKSVVLLNEKIENATLKRIDQRQTVIADRKRNWEREELKDSECVRLNELLNEGDNDAILAQAKFLAVSEDPVRRHAVIGALGWLGTPEAVDVLSELQNDEEEDIAVDSFFSIEHFFDKMLAEILVDPATGELVCDRDVTEYYDTCTQAIKNAESLDNSDILMTKVIALDPKIALPILLDVLENGSSGQKEMALKMLDVATHGAGVTNREEAMVWLLEDQEIYTK